MGSNVVQMTDPTFMLELRDRVWTDYDTKLTKRINEREVKFLVNFFSIWIIHIDFVLH